MLLIQVIAICLLILHISMYVIRAVWVLSPLIVLCLYSINIVKPFKIHKAVRLSDAGRVKLFHSMAIIWYCGFCILFYKYIIVLKLFNKYNNETTQSIYNFAILTLVYIAICIVANLIFFKNMSIRKLSIRGVELTVNEIDDMARSAIIRKENYDLLCQVFLTEYEVMAGVMDYINNITSVDENSIYADFLDFYAKLRGNISIQCYYNTLDGLTDMKQKNRITDVEFSTIQYSLEMNGVCIPPQDKIEIIYAKLVTSFVFPDIVVKMEGKKLFEQEHLVLQNIVSLFDKELIINSR